MHGAPLGSPGDLCPFPNLGKAACAQVRKRDSASNAQQLTHSYTCSCWTRQSQKAAVASLHVCAGAGKGGSHQAADGWVVLQLLENQVTAQPRRAFTTPTGMGGGGFHLEKGGPGGAQSRWAGSCIPDRDRPCSRGTGQHWSPRGFQEWNRSRGQDFPLFGTFPQTAMLIWDANTCKLATVMFLSVEKCGEREEGEAGRTQGSWKNDVLSFFLVDFFVVFLFLKVHSFE